MYLCVNGPRRIDGSPPPRTKDTQEEESPTKPATDDKAGESSEEASSGDEPTEDA